jgi:DNA-binding response OmpR family regulator
MKKRILIIDDEKNIRLTLSQCLEHSNYQVETAVSGEHGLEKYAENNFDLVLLDMKMPGINGMEVLRRIKRQNPIQKIIMITAYGTIETAVEAMKLGAVDYLRKPFTPEEIRSIVKRVLERENIDESEAISSFDAALEFAKGCINKRDYDKAYEYLKKAVSMEPAKPEPYNLMGALLELKSEFTEALKMYRAALAIDPTYKPAEANLRRATEWRYTRNGIDLGDETGEDSEAGNAEKLEQK